MTDSVKESIIRGKKILSEYIFGANNVEVGYEESEWQADSECLESLITAAQETERLSKLLMDRLDENIKLRARIADL